MTLFPLARWLAPERDHDWLEAMRLELPFVPARARWRWEVAALGLALRWRLFALTRSTQAPVALASLLTAALVIVLVAVPQPGGLFERSVVGLPDTATVHEAPLPAAPSLPAPAADAVTAAESLDPEPPSPALSAARSLAADRAAYALPGGRAELVARRAVTVTLGQETRALRAGERWGLELLERTRLGVSDAGALTLEAEGLYLERLGPDGEALEVWLGPQP